MPEAVFVNGNNEMKYMCFKFSSLRVKMIGIFRTLSVHMNGRRQVYRMCFTKKAYREGIRSK